MGLILRPRRNAGLLACVNCMSHQLPSPKKDREVLVYEVEVDEDEFEEPIEVPLEAKDTRLVVRLRPHPHVFSV
jgi:hypothetical protein